MLAKTEGAMQNYQSKDTGNNRDKAQNEDKQRKTKHKIVGIKLLAITIVNIVSMVVFSGYSGFLNQ
jgi:hypothetical protein